jgi:hypothetical protein
VIFDKIENVKDPVKEAMKKKTNCAPLFWTVRPRERGDPGVK